MVQALAASTDPRVRAGILSDAFLSGHRAFFTGVRLAYDPVVLFGVSHVAEIAADDLNPDDPGRFGFDDFVRLADHLRRGDLKGPVAGAAIDDAARACHGPTWNLFYRRILRKERMIGGDAASINRVLTRLGKKLPEARHWLIPVFGCQLAQTGAAIVPAGRRLLDAKLAGRRTLAVLDKNYGTVALFDPHGQPRGDLAAIHAGLRQVLTALPGSLVLDGVLRAGPDGAVRLALFDMLPLHDFRLGLCTQPQWQRHHSLSLLETSGLLRQAGGTAYVVSKQEVDFDTDDGQAAYATFQREARAAGMTGIMIKDPEAPYRFKRQAAWLAQDCGRAEGA